MTSATAAVPSGIDAVDPAWLTDALRADPTIPDDATVTDVVAEQIALDSGFSSLLYRLHLTGSPGVPATMIAKLAAQSEARGAMELLGGYRRELAFYRDIAGRAPMDAPHVYAARMADDSVDFVLLLEDLRDWDNADHLAGLSLERARLCIAQLAGLHAWSVQPSNTPRCRCFRASICPRSATCWCPPSGLAGTSTVRIRTRRCLSPSPASRSGSPSMPRPRWPA